MDEVEYLQVVYGLAYLELKGIYIMKILKGTCEIAFRIQSHIDTEYGSNGPR